MTSGASNFKMQSLVKTKDGLAILPSIEVILFYSAFIYVGLVPMILSYSLLWQQLESPLDPLLGAHGAFIIIGFILRWIIRKGRMNFNQHTRIIHASDQSIPFNNVYALQVITSLAGGRGHGIYKCSELNLILKDGQRINLLNHGDELEFEDQERQISKLLNVPVWQA
jgi:hypothetical protein